jgi:hypothetical protein
MFSFHFPFSVSTSTTRHQGFVLADCNFWDYLLPRYVGTLGGSTLKYLLVMVLVHVFPAESPLLPYKSENVSASEHFYDFLNSCEMRLSQSVIPVLRHNVDK